MGYSPWGRKESDTSEQLHFIFTLDTTLRREMNLIQVLGGVYLRSMSWHRIKEQSRRALPNKARFSYPFGDSCIFPWASLVAQG